MKRLGLGIAIIVFPMLLNASNGFNKNLNMCVVVSDIVAFFPSTMEEQISRDNVRYKKKNDEKVLLTYLDDRDTKLIDVIAQKIELRNGKACYTLLKVYDYSTRKYSRRVTRFGQSVYGKSLKKDQFKYEDIVKIGSTRIDMKKEKEQEEKEAALKREKEALLAKLALEEKQAKEKAEKLLTSKKKDIKSFAVCMLSDNGMFNLTKKTLENIEVDFTKKYEQSSFNSYQSKDAYVINMSANKKSNLITTRLQELDSGEFCLQIYEVISSKNGNNKVLNKKNTLKVLQELNKI